MINNIIIFGSNGMLGRYLYTYFGYYYHTKNYEKLSVHGITRKEYDIIDGFDNLEQILIDCDINNNTCVINCTGLIPQRYTNINSNINYYLINSIFPQVLSRLCDKYQAKLIQPTTDCIYNGTKGNYTELNIPDETSHYGVSKALGEPSNCTVIRVSIIGEEKENKKSLLEWVKNSKGEINGWDNHIWNGITCLQYCKIIQQIIEQNLFWKGTRHLFSPTEKTKYELITIIRDVYNPQLVINKVSAKGRADKTLFSIYNDNNLFNIPELDIQIKELKDFNLI